MKRSVTQLSNQLMASYAQLGGINHLEGINLPSKSAIEGITKDLLRLLFPGFYEDQAVTLADIKMEIANQMDSLHERLEDEIHKSIEYFSEGERSSTNLRDESQELTHQFLTRLPSIRELLQSDAEAAFTGDPAAFSIEEVMVAFPFMEAIGVQRLAHELYNMKIALIPRIMAEWAHGETGIDLHPGAEIGSHFFIDHGTGTVIGETCRIGNHVKVYHGVTLGAKSTSGGQRLRGVKRHPTIEDNVTIYPGAAILGGKTVIGRGSTIGGNVFLVESVPPNSLVIVENAKVKVMTKTQKEKDTYSI